MSARAPANGACGAAPKNECGLCNAANRQYIVYFFPTAHRLPYVAPDRQYIVKIGGGGERCSQSSGTRSLAWHGPLRPQGGAAGEAETRAFPEEPGRNRQATGPVKSVPGALPADSVGRNLHQPLSKVSAPADIHGGDEVAEERPSGLNDVLSVRTMQYYARAKDSHKSQAPAPGHRLSRRWRFRLVCDHLACRGNT
jgi:hypothetical protein